MPKANSNGRINQRQRTRKDLLQAAARLIKQGEKPSLEEIAEEALVSRATAYRYFPGLDALLLEASLDVDTPDAGELFDESAPEDPIARLEIVDDALTAMIEAYEPQLRTMLAHSLQQALDPSADENLPSRQNRRTPLIEAALSPARGRIKPAELRKLKSVLALVIGTEASVVFKDVLQLDPAESKRVKRWAIRALVQAALERSQD